MKKTLATSLVALGLLAAGCGPQEEALQPSGVRPIRVENPKFAAEAGIDAQVNPEPSATLQAIGKARPFGSRPNAFAMLPAEVAFDRSQRAERLVADVGGFSLLYEEPLESEVDAAPVIEPVPAWRLSGVVIRDGVIAILDMGDKTLDIRPGQRIPDTEWTVVSIDTERAVLRRSGTKLPRQITIPLQGTLPGQGGGGNAPAQGGGAPAGGGEQGGDERSQRGGRGSRTGAG